MDGIIDNLRNAIETWNEKLAEIWTLLTEDPEHFKGGVIWRVIVYTWSIAGDRCSPAGALFCCRRC